MPSSEILYCKICGRRFETIESLQEHLMAEKEEVFVDTIKAWKMKKIDLHKKPAVFLLYAGPK